MNIRILNLILLIFVFSNAKSISQKDTIASSKSDTSLVVKKSALFLVYPIAFYSPETRWAGGVAGIYSFRFRGESLQSNPSQIHTSIGYTQNKQILFTLPFELYFRQNKYKVKGELGYFRYFYNFYGIGNSTALSDRESYEVHFPRFRLDALHRIGKSFIGLRYRFDNFDIKKVKENGILATQTITGKSGGTISGLGIIWQYDTRDHLYNATKGVYIEAEVYVNDALTRSDFTYQRLSTDISRYFKIANDHTLAFNADIIQILGDPIFYDLPYIGSPRLLRGYQDRRFMDRSLVALQGEYRYPIYKRFQGVAFVGAGNVANRIDQVFDSELKLAYGVGLRYIMNRNDRVRLRLDYGRTAREGGAYYVTINDAF